MSRARWTRGLSSLGCCLALLPTQPVSPVDLPRLSASDGARLLVLAIETQARVALTPCEFRAPVENGTRRCGRTTVDPWRLGEIAGGEVQRLAEEGSIVWVETDASAQGEWLARIGFARIAHVVDGTLVEVWIRTDPRGISRPIQIVTRAAPRTIPPFLPAPLN